MSERQHWAVLGGGMLGLTLAYRLTRRGYRISLFETSDEWGGLASAWKLDGIVWDRFYHVTLSSDAHLVRLLTDLGVEGDLRWKKTGAGIYKSGVFHPLSNAMDYLRLPLVGPIDKIRLAATLLATARRTDWEAIEQESVERYLRRWSGDRVFERIWLPLLRAKLGENYRRVSAAFIWAVVRRLMAARRSGLKQDLFGYVSGGYRHILSVMCEALAGMGADLNLGHEATAVRAAAGGRVSVRFANGRSEEFDRVIITLPSGEAARVCEDLTGAEREALAHVQYQGIVCASLLLRRPLTKHYLTYIAEADTPITGVIEMSNLVDPAELGGYHLVYLPRYVAQDDPVLEQPHEEILDLLLEGVRRIHPDLLPDDIVCSRVAIARRVFALPVPGYSRMLPPTRTSVPGLHILNGSHILDGTLNVNETVRLAEEYAGTC